jgi:hypothetical protein
MIGTLSLRIRAGLLDRITPIAWRLWWTWRRSQWLRSEPWASAFPGEALVTAGLEHDDLKWLFANNLLATQREQMAKRRGRDRNRSSSDDALVLTEAGAAFLQRFCLPAYKPHWDAAHRELSVDRDVIKSFHRPSENQQLVLAAFQEDGWADQIDDPLPRKSLMGDTQAKTRLRKTVEHLHRGQHPPSLLFRATGNGQCIAWSFGYSGHHLSDLSDSVPIQLLPPD